MAGWLAQWPARSRKVRSEPPVLPLMFVPAVNHIIESISRIRQCSFPCVPRTRMTRLPGCRRGPARQSGYANSARLSPTTSHPRMRQRTGLAIALAAGEATRMRSPLPKVLHPLGGRPLIEHVLAAAARACGTEIAVVVGPDHDAVAAAARRIVPCAPGFEQRERRRRCGAGGEAGHRAEARRYFGDFRGYALSARRDARKVARGHCRGCGGGSARLHTGRSAWLGPAGDARS